MAEQRTPSAVHDEPELLTEDSMLPAADPGIEIYLRNRRPANLTAFTPGNIALFGCGSEYIQWRKTNGAT